MIKSVNRVNGIFNVAFPSDILAGQHFTATRPEENKPQGGGEGFKAVFDEAVEKVKEEEDARRNRRIFRNA